MWTVVVHSSYFIQYDLGTAFITGIQTCFTSLKAFRYVFTLLIIGIQTCFDFTHYRHSDMFWLHSLKAFRHVLTSFITGIQACLTSHYRHSDMFGIIHYRYSDILWLHYSYSDMFWLYSLQVFRHVLAPTSKQYSDWYIGCTSNRHSDWCLECTHYKYSDWCIDFSLQVFKHILTVIILGI